MKNLKQNESGFTLVELIVVMAIFLVVIMITGSIFETLLKSSVKTSKSAESQITDIIGLELMRADIKHAGYGLPLVLPAGTSYQEAPSVSNTPVTGVNRANYNDATTNVPRPFRLGDNVGLNGSDYLALKATSLSPDFTATKWNYMTFSGIQKNWSVPNDNLAEGDNVIVVDPAPNSTTAEQRQLVTGGSFYATVASGDLASSYKPTDDNHTYVIYGLTNPGTTPRMPFNRADYYIKTPATGMSQRCAAGTGILYKAQMNQSDGSFTEIPLMDCVGDIQVAFDLATGAPSDNAVNLHVDNLTSLTTPFQISSQVKAVRLYVLTHEGQRDTLYSYPSNTINVGESFDGVTNLGSVWTPTGASGTRNLGATFTNWRNYRWKVLRLVVTPNNLYN
jgi:prepilin-type N-terminal cleavage/methylation domain-containing protein